jgi:predicted RNA binding protein YcfA (HicA-like mRNA interferase family)
MVTAKRMTGTELVKMLRSLGCSVLRQKGSHLRIRCGKCFTTVPVHKGETLGIGIMNAIEKDLEPCLGEGWLS